MALIGEIRKNSWLLVITIGLALAAFILMDMFSGDKSIFGSQQFNAGTINGEKVSWNEFQNAENILYRNASGDPYARRQALWNFFVEDKLVADEADALGLSVSRDELMDLQFGANPSPIIQQSFRDPQTNQLNRTELDNFKKAIEDNTLAGYPRQYWALQEKQIIKDRLQTKLSNMIGKGMYTPTWMVQQTHAEQSQKVGFNFVKIPYDNVSGDVAVSDSDLNAYLNENAAAYTNDEETRKLEFVTFEVKPTKADSVAIRKELAGLKSIFAESTTDDLANFTSNNNGSYQDRYLKESEVTSSKKKAFFSREVGTVVGPFLENGSYQLARIVDRRVLPDSAKSRHILISASTEDQFAQAQKTIDSLKTLIVTGQSRFDSLAVKFSQDPGSAKDGGVYDNVGINQFVPEYRDVIFFSGNIGKLYSVRTQYGIHLIEPMGRTTGSNETYVKLAYINQAVVPSEETQDTEYTKVYDLVNTAKSIDDLKQIAANAGLELESSPLLKKNDYLIGTLGSGQASRDMIRWAFSSDTNKGDVSPEVHTYQDQVNFYNNKYVLAGLRSVQAEGKPSLDNIRDVIQPIVLNQKKAATIQSAVQGKNLASIASSYSAEVDTVKSVSFNASFVPGVGNEPKVVASAFNLNVNDISAPIAGQSGIYVVQMTDKPEVGQASNIPALRKTANTSAQSQVRAQLMSSMRKDANVEDNRGNFY